MTTQSVLDTTLTAFEEMLVAEQEGFLRLPAADLTSAAAIAAALEDFRPRDVPAGRAAAKWLSESALEEYLTARTVLLLGRGRVVGFYTLAAASVRLTPDERLAARVVADRANTPASLLAWVARDPQAETSGSNMLWHAVASSRQAAELHASAVFVLDAYDETTAEMWLNRDLNLRRLGRQPTRLWLPLG